MNLGTDFHFLKKIRAYLKEEDYYLTSTYVMLGILHIRTFSAKAPVPRNERTIFVPRILPNKALDSTTKGQSV